MAEAPFQEYPTYSDRGSGSSKIILIFCLLFGLVICCLVALYWLGSQSNRPQIASVPADMIDPTKEPTPTLSPSATPTPLEKSAITLSVLNGSGRVGAGRTIATYLKNKGYTVTVVGDSRATTSAGLTLKITKETEAYKTMLENDLKEAPISGSGSGAITTKVDDTITTDAEITVGK